MNDWQTVESTMTVVGPSLSDRMRVAWLILRGYTRLQFTISFSAKSTEAVCMDVTTAQLKRPYKEGRYD